MNMLNQKQNKEHNIETLIKVTLGMLFIIVVVSGVAAIIFIVNLLVKFHGIYQRYYDNISNTHLINKTNDTSCPGVNNNVLLSVYQKYYINKSKTCLINKVNNTPRPVIDNVSLLVFNIKNSYKKITFSINGHNFTKESVVYINTGCGWKRVKFIKYINKNKILISLITKTRKYAWRIKVKNGEKYSNETYLNFMKD